MLVILILCGFGAYAFPEFKSNDYCFTHNIEETYSSINIPQEEWNKTFGGVENDFATRVLQTVDGGYVFVGQRDGSGHHSDGDCWLIKVDEYGNLIWEKIFGGNDNEIGYDIDQTIDGGYIVFGITSSYGAGNDDGWLIKTDSNGNEMWNRTFGGSDLDTILSGQQTSDGGYILAGGTQSFGAGNSAGWFIKTDSNGEEMWRRVFDEGDSISEYFMSVYQTVDGGYIATGRRYLNENDWVHSDVWLFKTDSNGNEEWSTLIGDQYGDGGRSIFQTSDGGYIITGQSGRSEGNGDWDAVLIKTDVNGGTEWVSYFGDNTHSETGYSVVQTNDEGFLITGRKILHNTDLSDIFLIKTDRYGNFLWTEIFRGELSDDRGYDACQTNDGGYIVIGYTNYYGSGGLDAWLIKILPFENQRPNKPSRPSGRTNGETGVEYIYTTSTTDSDGDDVYYLFDWGDGSTSFILGPYESGAECSASGIWFDEGSYEIKVKAIDEHGAESEWSDPLIVSMPKSYNLFDLMFFKFFSKLIYFADLFLDY